MKARYFFPLIEAATRDFKEKIKEQFSQYQFFKEGMDILFSLKEDTTVQNKFIFWILVVQSPVN